jgi:hypothetical protein
MNFAGPSDTYEIAGDGDRDCGLVKGRQTCVSLRFPAGS